MNTKEKEKEIKVESIGQQLKNARKILKMTKSKIAEKLCLKTSIIHDIENDQIPNNLELIFFKGYIRAYARLVHVPKEKLKLNLDSEQFLNKYQHTSIKTYLYTCDKKKNQWLIILLAFSFILIVCILIMFLWKNNKKLKNNSIFTTEKNFSTKEKNSKFIFKN